ncbi:MAG: hypothetical protein IJD10_01645 [Clostridia bacterium]|nr:hypothetical protein [Clostridia bacterium]
MTNWEMVSNLQRQEREGLNGITREDWVNLQKQIGVTLRGDDEYKGPLKAVELPPKAGFIQRLKY